MFHQGANHKSSKIKVKRQKIKIHDDSFEPAYIKIEKGETVEWTLFFKMEPSDGSSLSHNKKRRPHVVTFDSRPEESGLMGCITDSFKVKFDEVGVFTYKCSMNVRMHGKIEVVDNQKE